MPNKNHKAEVARTVRRQLDNPAFTRALRSGYRPLKIDDQFRTLLMRLDESEKKHPEVRL